MVGFSCLWGFCNIAFNAGLPLRSPGCSSNLGEKENLLQMPGDVYLCVKGQGQKQAFVLPRNNYWVKIDQTL